MFSMLSTVMWAWPAMHEFYAPVGAKNATYTQPPESNTILELQTLLPVTISLGRVTPLLYSTSLFNERLL